MHSGETSAACPVVRKTLYYPLARVTPLGLQVSRDRANWHGSQRFPPAGHGVSFLRPGLSLKLIEACVHPAIRQGCSFARTSGGGTQSSFNGDPPGGLFFKTTKSDAVARCDRARVAPLKFWRVSSSHYRSSDHTNDGCGDNHDHRVQHLYPQCSVERGWQHPHRHRGHHWYRGDKGKEE